MIADHKAVEQLFKRFDRSRHRTSVERPSIVDRIIEALSIQASIEAQDLCPNVRAGLRRAAVRGWRHLEPVAC